MAGLQTLPCTIKQLSDEDTVQVMVNTKLQARETILPSEKAFAYKMKLDALKHQGKATSRQVVGKLESADKISESESGRQVQRYIRLTHLIPELLKLVDEEKIALTPAVEISYIDEQGQEEILDYINNFDVTPNLSQALELKRKYSEGMLDEDTVYDILGKEKGNQKEMYQLPYDTILKNFQTKERKILRTAGPGISEETSNNHGNGFYGDGSVEESGESMRHGNSDGRGSEPVSLIPISDWKK